MAIDEDVILELRTRIFPTIDNILNSASVDLKLFHLESHQTGREKLENFEVNELLTRSSLDHKAPPTLRIIAGKVGSGRTTLGISLLRAWLLCDNSSFKEIYKFKLCLLIDGTRLYENDIWQQLQSWLPDTLKHYGQSSLAHWLENAKILLIIDNIFYFSEQVQNLHALLDAWIGAEAIILTHLTSSDKLEELVRGKNFFYGQFKNLSNIINIDIIEHFSRFYEFDSFENIKENDISVLLDTIGGIKYVWEAMHNKIIQDTNGPMSDVVWNITFNKVNDITMAHCLSREKVGEWLTILCQRCYECLAKGAPFLGSDAEYLIEVTNHLFPELPDSKALVGALLPAQVSLSTRTGLIWSVHHEVQLEVFASWYVLQKCMDGTPMKRLLKKIECEDPFSIYAAGLLKKLLTEEHKFFRNFEDDNNQRREKKIERVIKNLGVQTERSSDPTSFIFRVIHEMQCYPLLTKMFLQDSYIPPHLHIRDIAIYEDAFQTIIDHSTPTKVYLLVRKEYQPLHLYATVKFIQSMTVDLALALMNHLKWRSSIRSNDYLEILNQSGCSLKLVDFIGCLDNHFISDLHKWNATKDIVCLRVRICDGDSAKSLVNCQDNLKSLMWLEIDFDFPLHDVLQLSLPKIRTPLIDLSFCNVCDSDILKICDFLHSISHRYSGIHIHESSVSPQGVTEMLKYFYRRSMVMNADAKAINKYRKYRFPEFSAIDPREEVDDVKAERLLGYDDRHHYSDNEIHSSYLSTKEEANILKNFFGVMTEVRYFKYSCMNFIITKENDGSCLATKRNF